MLDTIQTLVEMVAVIVATGVAVWGLDTWRREIVGRRKTEIAEEVLAGIYQYREIMDWVRLDASWKGEGGTREADENEDPKEREYRNQYFIPIERLQQHSEFLGRFNALKYSFIAYFGEDAGEPFDLINHVRATVVSSCHALMDHYRYQTNDAEDRELMLEWQRNLGRKTKENDPLKPKIDEAVKIIEDICRPHLSDGKSK